MMVKTQKTFNLSPGMLSRARGEDANQASGTAFGPGGVTARWVFVTPELAYDWLENQEANRSLSKDHASKFIRDLSAGRWMLSNQGLAIDTNGKIIDGQHRLYAIFESGVSAWMLVVEGLPRETQRIIDDTRKRQFADDLKIEGDSDYSQKAATTKLVTKAEESWEYDLSFATAATRTYGRAELRDRLQDMELEVDMARAVRFGQRAHNQAQLHASAGAALYYLVSVHGAGKEAAEAFLERVIQGYGLYPGDPELALRHRTAKLAKQQPRPGNTVHLAHALKAYNAWAKGKNMHRCEFKTTGAKFPEVVPSLKRAI